MHDRDDLAEQLVDLVDSSAPPIAFDEVVERARIGTSAPRPRRGGRFVAAGLAFALIAAAGVVGVTSRHAATRRRPAVVVAPTDATTTTTTNIASTYVHRPPTGVMGVIGPRSGWRLDGLSLSRTDDDGATWSDITPPNAVNQDPIARIYWVEFFDSQHVLVPVVVNSRPFTIYGSDDGGHTWHTVCVGQAECGAQEYVAFLDRDHGWGISDSGNVSSTNDGGHTWTLLGSAPFAGPIHFVNEQDGWGVSEPSGYGNAGVATKPGGELFRTNDGGHTWKPFLPDIGGTLSFGVPQFFGAEGVVVGWDEPNKGSGHHDQIRVYTTHDGGTSWRGQVAPPSDPASDQYGNLPTLSAPVFPFSASSPTDWMLFIGPNVYVTDDAGAHWTTFTTEPAIGRVESLALTSRSTAWALASVPICDNPSPPQRPCRLEELVRTTDGGRTWPAVPTP